MSCTRIHISTEEIASGSCKQECITLAKIAIDMREKAYAPYSRFSVGVALVADDDTVFTGCNIENASYPVGICAERTAFAKAVSKGYTRFKAILIAGGPDDKDGSDFCPPCGMCRQTMREFCDGDFLVVLVKAGPDMKSPELKMMTLAELLPESFGPDYLG